MWKTLKDSYRKITKSKTLLFSVLLAIFGTVEVSFSVFKTYLSPEAYGITLIVISVIVAVLRVVTKIPLDDK